MSDIRQQTSDVWHGTTETIDVTSDVCNERGFELFGSSFTLLSSFGFVWSPASDYALDSMFAIVTFHIHRAWGMDKRTYVGTIWSQ